MRSPLSLTVLVFVFACGHPQIALRPQPANGTPLGIAVDSVARITLTRGIGGWGNGADYWFEFSLVGHARYHGGLRSPILGDYEAKIPDSTLTSLRNLLTHPGALRASNGFCYDAFTAVILLVFADSTRSLVTASCGAPEENTRLADALDLIGGHLSWRPMTP